MKKIFALLLAVLLLVSLIACNGNDTPDTTPPDGGSSLDTSLEIKVWTLNGTTGFGMAPLMQNKTNGTAALNYSFTIETKQSNVRDAIISGTADIAAVPTNIASVLYNATNGGVTVLALNTGGVLYLVVNTTAGAAAASLSDLVGKTVYTPADNPAHITKALIEKAGVTGITLDSTTYSAPAELQKAVAEGLVDYAVLPEPMVTIAKNAAAKAGRTIDVALDLTAEWNKHFANGSLVQGCVVVRNEFLQAHPNEVKKFMEEYKASIEFVNQNPEEASAAIAAAGIFAQAAVAKAAIPKCNIAYVEGEAMKTALSTFLATMPLPSVGGALPADAFYYVSK